MFFFLCEILRVVFFSCHLNLMICVNFVCLVPIFISKSVFIFTNFVCLFDCGLFNGSVSYPYTFHNVSILRTPG